MPKLRNVSSARLADLRRGKHLTQHDLASRLRGRGFGTTQVTVSRWENGQQPNSSVLPALAAELGCKMHELFESDEDDESSQMPTKAESDFVAAVDALVNERIALALARKVAA